MSSLYEDLNATYDPTDTILGDKQLAAAKAQVKDGLVEALGLGPSEGLVAHFGPEAYNAVKPMLGNILPDLPENLTMEGLQSSLKSSIDSGLTGIREGAADLLENTIKPAANNALNAIGDTISGLKNNAIDSLNNTFGDTVANAQMRGLFPGARSTKMTPVDEEFGNESLDNNIPRTLSSSFEKTNIPPTESEMPSMRQPINRAPIQRSAEPETSMEMDNFAKTVPESEAVDTGVDAGLESAGAALDSTGIGAIGGLILGLAGLGGSLGELFGDHKPKITLPNIIAAPQMV